MGERLDPRLAVTFEEFLRMVVYEQEALGRVMAVTNEHAVLPFERFASNIAPISTIVR